ncbi:MAG TPA: hypothetical protein PKJ41_00385 [Bryobacteraceae bacterium]|nr:hypothetical protein [Bryobacteraceae bacterium]HPT24875.1 hypothetical protein [Bryobacteraceae bacterium]
MERLQGELSNHHNAGHTHHAAIQTADRLTGKLNNRKYPVRP